MSVFDSHTPEPEFDDDEPSQEVLGTDFTQLTQSTEPDEPPKKRRKRATPATKSLATTTTPTIAPTDPVANKQPKQKAVRLLVSRPATSTPTLSATPALTPPPPTGDEDTTPTAASTTQRRPAAKRSRKPVNKITADDHLLGVTLPLSQPSAQMPPFLIPPTFYPFADLPFPGLYDLGGVFFRVGSIDTVHPDLTFLVQHMRTTGITLQQSLAKMHALRKQLLLDNKAKSQSGKLKFKSDKDQLRHQAKLWKTICRKEIPKAQKAMQARTTELQNKAKRLADMCSKAIRKQASKSQRAGNDGPLRSKRMMKEVMQFWRRFDREQAETKKRADKEEAERRKREAEQHEKDKEAKRLNFLLTQTQLYSHFMAQKLGMESSSTDDAQTQEDMPHQSPIPIPPPPPSVPAFAGTAKELAMLDAAELDDLQMQAAAHQIAQQTLQNNLMQARAFDAKMTSFSAKGKTSTSPDASDRSTSTTSSIATTSTSMPPSGVARIPSTNIDTNTTPGSDVSPNANGVTNHTLSMTAPSSMPEELTVEQPKCFKGALKSFQLKGLNWLVNLYEQGINGILADEMGLGKTVQSISLLCHLVERGLWGPFLVVAPTITLTNWTTEVSSFCPQLKVLPYWGTQNDRAILRKRRWDPKLLGNANSPFHVVVTSYQLLVLDHKFFDKIHWLYLICDEAQAMKSSSSKRWKTMLKLKCRNRLLLTGTPIQNSMAELWALLHFIMPTLFDSHEQFNQWFSKDIESHAQQKGQLDQQQVSRLHLILKPFMLRRVKRDVENEMAAKIEREVLCEMAGRQKRIYEAVKGRINTQDLLVANTDNLMNIVMQLRKVCNHPEIFERRECHSPFQFVRLAPSPVHHTNVYACTTNPICVMVPGPVAELAYSPTSLGCAVAQLDTVNRNSLSIWTPEFIHSNEFGEGAFSWARLSGFSAGAVHGIAQADALERFEFDFEHRTQMETLWRANQSRSDADSAPDWWGSLLVCERKKRDVNDLLRVVRTRRLHQQADTQDVPPPLIACSARDVLQQNAECVFALQQVHALPKAVAPAPGFSIVGTSSLCLMHRHNNAVSSRVAFMTLMNAANSGVCREIRALPRTRAPLIGASPRHMSLMQRVVSQGHPGLVQAFDVGAASHNTCVLGCGGVIVPSIQDLVFDSAKLRYLDKLLPQLKRQKHRVLLYSQMTKMLDIIEDYMVGRRFRYVRLDGSCSIAVRNDTVKKFQTDPGIFVFLLSTRAGGVGINLTAADTVIFYDIDWNPTMDAQAMDRTHRIGQTKQVTVYRLMVRGTVEERILTRAKAKDRIQQTVYGGKFALNDWKNQEMLGLLIDENDDKGLAALREAQLQSENAANGKQHTSTPSASMGPPAARARAPAKRKQPQDGTPKPKAKRACPAKKKGT